MSLTNTAKPSTSITNTAKVSFAETWASITSVWSAESRSWLDTGSLFTNTAKPTTSITNTAKPI